MKKNTLFIVALFLATFCYSQKVVIVGINHVSVNANPNINDGFSFVATENISAGEIIYFTDNEYDNTTNVFSFNGFPSGEAVVIYTVGAGGLNKDVVVYLEETSLNTFTASCSSGNCGTAVMSSNSTNSPSFALSTNGEALYAYADTNDDVTDGISEIYSVLYTGSGEAPSQNGGAIPAVQNPVVDFPNALVIDGFPDDTDNFVGLDRVEYKFSPTSLRQDVTRADFQDINNWVHTQPNADLSIVAFSNVDASASVDADGDGASSDVDCDDNDDTVYPGAPELCDGKDNDCTNGIDDGLTFLTYYPDADSDGFGDASGVGESLCEDPLDGRVANNTDCDDNDDTVYPGAPELCDGKDNDCANGVDDGLLLLTCPADIILDCGETDVVLEVPTVINNCATTGNALDFEGLSNGFKIPDLTVEGIQEKLLEDGPITGATISAWIYPRVSDPEYSSLDINRQIFEANTWQHIAFTYDTSILKIYLNGVLLGSVPVSTLQILAIIDNFGTALPEVSNALQNLNMPSFPFTLSGKLDEVHIWKGARTQEEIQTEMNSEIDAQANLIALYHFNQGVASADNTGLINVIDDSGNGFDLTLSNFALNGPTSNWVEGKSFNGVTLTNDAPTSYSPIEYSLDGYTLTWNGPNTATYPVGDTTVTWTATDAAGNETTCEQIVTVSSGDYTWTGNIDSNWTNNGNWVDNLGPGLDASGNINIPIVNTGYPILTAGQHLNISECSVLYVSSDASLTFNPTVVLTNNGTVEVATDGMVTFESDPSGTAYIGAGMGDFIGDFTVERHIPARRAFRFLSTAVTTSDFILNNWQKDTHITGSTTDGENGFDGTVTGNPSMFTYNNMAQTWNAISNTDDTNLTSGTPYRLMVRGDRTIDLNNNAPTPTPTTLMSKGALTAENNGSRTSALNATAGGFSFIGNPFQAQVDMGMILQNNSNNVIPVFYWVWDPTLGIRGAYVTVDFFNPVANPTAGEQNQFLQAGQACFVQTNTESAASVTFTQASKNSSEPETKVFRSSAKKSANSSRAQLSIKLYESSAYLANLTPADGVSVYFDDAGNNDVDAFDAPDFTNLDENLATNNNGNLLSVESRATPFIPDEIQLEINTYRNTDYVLEANAQDLKGDTPLLLDTYLNETTEIAQNGMITYAYSIDSGIPASFAGDRFKIIFEKTLSVTNRDLNDILLYPNPTNTGNFYLNIPQRINDLEVTIYNALGAKVSHTKNLTTGNKVSVDANFIKNVGVYFVKMSSRGSTTTKKLIIN